MILFDGREFSKINEFDCHIIDFVKRNGGRYLTSIPISPIEYRKTLSEGSPCKVEISRDDQFTHFAITNDYGKTKTVSIGNEHADYINGAIAGAKRQGLIVFG